MIRICLLVLLVLLGSLASLDPVAAQTAFRDTARRLAPDATSVTSCTTSDRSGQYRTVVFLRGFEHLSSEVYLQWLAWDERGAHVLRSVLVAELSTGSWTVGEPVIVSRETCSMRFEATHSYNLEVARYVLQPRGRDRYSIRRVVKQW